MNQPNNSSPLRADVVESARLLGISRAHLYQHIKAGRITPIKDGKRTLFLMSELQRFAAQSSAA